MSIELSWFCGCLGRAESLYIDLSVLELTIYIDQAILELSNSLPWSPECWDQRNVSTHKLLMNQGLSPFIMADEKYRI